MQKTRIYIDIYHKDGDSQAAADTIRKFVKDGWKNDLAEVIGERVAAWLDNRSNLLFRVYGPGIDD